MIEFTELTEHEKIIAEQHRLNRKKFILNTRTDQTLADWIELANSYAAIDSKGNFAYCMNKARYFGYKPEPVNDEIPEPEYRDYTDV